MSVTYLHHAMTSAYSNHLWGLTIVKLFSFLYLPTYIFVLPSTNPPPWMKIMAPSDSVELLRGWYTRTNIDHCHWKLPYSVTTIVRSLFKSLKYSLACQTGYARKREPNWQLIHRGRSTTVLVTALHQQLHPTFTPSHSVVSMSRFESQSQGGPISQRRQ
jgi:hypothetical protein